MMEEYAGGKRNALWLAWQVLSTVRRRRSRVPIQERRANMLANLWSDTRYAVRTVRRNPGFAVAAVAPIALGIGVNTGIFSILNSLALRPLPTPEPTALVSVYQEFRGVQQRRVKRFRDAAREVGVTYLLSSRAEQEWLDHLLEGDPPPGLMRSFESGGLKIWRLP